jgi:hypothetical protein
MIPFPYRNAHEIGQSKTLRDLEIQYISGLI